MLSEVKSFFEELNENSILLYHKDADGFSSASIMIKILENYGKKFKAFITPKESPRLTPSFFKRISKYKPDFIVAVDLSIHRDEALLKKLSKNAKLLIIDHHGDKYNPPVKIKNPNIIFIHSYFLKSKVNPSNYCSAKICYDLASSLKIKKLEWKTAVGLIGDVSEDSWNSFMDKAYKKYSKKELKLATDVINIVSHEKNKEKLILNTLVNAKKPKDIFQSNLFKTYSKINAERKRLVDEFEDKVEVIEDKKIMFYEMKSKYGISSSISNALCKSKSKKYTLFVMHIKKDKISISARNPSFKVHVGKLVNKSISKSWGVGGGHIPAAGANIKKEYKEIFKKNVIKNINDSKL